MSRVLSRMMFTACLVGLLALATGCVEATLLVKVRTDGSGVMQQRLSVHPSFATNMQGGGLEVNEQQYRNAGATMGMRYVSARKVTRKNGWQGIVVNYEFDDIASVKLVPESGQMANGVMKQAAGYTFDFQINENSRELIVNVPSMTGKSAAPPAEGEVDVSELMDEPPPGAEMPAISEADKAQFTNAMTTLKPYARDVKFNLVLVVDGAITETNAMYRSQMHPNMVQLLSVDMAKMVEDEAAVQKVLASGDDIHSVPGIQAQTETLRITFR